MLIFKDSILTDVFVLQVVRCCLEHAASVAKTFLTSDVVVVEIKEPEPSVPAGNPMDNSGKSDMNDYMYMLSKNRTDV